MSNQSHLLRSCGRALIGTRIRAGDEHFETIEEIWVSGPQLMLGYANREEATSAAFDGEWFKTGDAGSIDVAGYLTIRDRLKDMIISGGENIYSIEVENALLSHPQITDAAVVGLPDSVLGEALVAFIVTPSKALDSETIISLCRPILAGYKIPRRFRFVDALPRNPSGKVLKDELRSLL